MKYYELLCILPGTLAENELAPAVGTLKDLLMAEGATDIRVEDKGKNRLTYPMKHIRYGYFYFFIFQAEADQIRMIQKKLQLTKEYLRTLINGYDPEKVKRHEEAMRRIEKRSAGGFMRPAEGDGAFVKTGVKLPLAPKEDTEEKKVDMKEINKKLEALLEGDMEQM